MQSIKISEKQIKSLKEAYEDNKCELAEVESTISNYGCCNNGLAEASESFEQGWNNAMEFVFQVLEI